MSWWLIGQYRSDIDHLYSPTCWRGLDVDVYSCLSWRGIHACRELCVVLIYFWSLYAASSGAVKPRETNVPCVMEPHVPEIDFRRNKLLSDSNVNYFAISHKICLCNLARRVTRYFVRILAESVHVDGQLGGKSSTEADIKTSSLHQMVKPCQ